VIKIIRSDEHFHHEEDWLSTFWHFSFDYYRDPQKTNFGPLRVFNDDIIKPGTGFGFHPHRDMEIITYVIDGELEHRDDRGNHGIIRAGEVQRMTAGTGITHSEYNHSKEKPLRLLQMWIFANRRGLNPFWEQQRFDKKERTDRLLPVVVPENTSNGKALHIHQDATIFVSSLDAGKTIEHRLESGRMAYLFIIDGRVRLGNNQMQSRDSAKIENEDQLSIEAENPTELLLIDLPVKYDVNS
jgi:hypothetical protein